METKELVRLHEQSMERDGVLSLTKIKGTRRADFRRLLNERADGRVPEGGKSYRNHVFGNRVRAYGDYLYACDRDMFEDNYRRWLLGDKN
jgi:hypothetical protein